MMDVSLDFDFQIQKVFFFVFQSTNIPTVDEYIIQIP